MQHSRLRTCTSSIVILAAVVGLPVFACAQSAAPSSTASSEAKPLEALMVAAQGLRDATHELVNQPASPARNATIQKIDRTLAEVQSAMVSLPSDVLRAEENATPSQKAADDLARAADQLQAATTSLNKASDSSAGIALADVRKALSSVQQERSNLQGSDVSEHNDDRARAGESAQARSLPEQLKRKMQNAGYTNIEIVPGSYLVSAKSQDGKNVMMRIGPNSMTVLTEVASGSEQSATEGQGSSQTK